MNTDAHEVLPSRGSALSLHSCMPKPLTLAAIDAGSNAIRAIIAHATGPSELTVVASERVPVRLGRETFTSGTLPTQTVEDATLAFSRFRKLFDEHGVSVYRAVATSALRSASNQEELLERLFREVGIELEVIDGEEEGRLVRKAVLARFPSKKPPRAIVDLGGGSLEIMQLQGDSWSGQSLKIGTVRLLETFGLKGAISDDELRMIRRFIRSSLRSNVPEAMRQSGIVEAAGCGGNTECLARLFGSEGDDNMQVLPLASLREALPELVSADIKTRMDKYGVRKDRAEVMGVAAIVLATLGKELDLERFVIPDVGIRDGVLLDLAESSVGKLVHSDEAPAIASARMFAARIGHNIKHGEHVRMIAQRLFIELASLHNLPKQSSTILQLAALLHDVGEVVHRKSHHKHSEYLIIQGRIPGLDNPARQMVAALARAHRKSLPTRKHETFASLEKRQQDQVMKMAVLLRLANTLDIGHRQNVVAIASEIKDKKIILSVSVDRGGGPSSEALDARSDDFETVFGRKLSLSFAEVSGSGKRHTS